jgi:hypothetical protein
VLSGIALVVTAAVLASLPSVRRTTQPVITAGR